MRNELKWSLVLFVVSIATTVMSAYMENTEVKIQTPRAYLSEWPTSSKIAAEKMLKLYGEPDAESDKIMIWLGKRDRKQVIVQKFDDQKP